MTFQASGKRRDAEAAPVIGSRLRVVAAIALVVALVAVALAGIASPAYAGTASAASKRPAPPPARAALDPSTALDQDLSGTLPALNVNEAPGDYLGEGHDQVASALPPNLEIRDNQKFGSDAVHDTPTDLRTTPNGGFSYYNGFETLTISPWQDSTYEGVGAQWPLTSAKVAASASNIYMVGATWDDNAVDPTHNDYQLHLYKLPHDGSCASAGCAEQTLNLPSYFPVGSQFPSRLIVASSLAVGVVGGRTLIAVGLSDFGIFVYDEDFNPVAHITDMAVSSGGQTPPSALAFGPPTGPGEGGLLTAGVVSPWETLYSWELDQRGVEKSLTRAGGFGGVAVNYATAAAAAQIGGHQYSVFGTVGGDVFVIDPDCPPGPPCEKVAFTAIGGLGPAVTGLTAVRSWDDDPGDQHLVVGLEDTTAEVLRYSGGALKPIALGANGETRVSWEQARGWFPGYGAGRLEVANGTAGAVSVSLRSKQDPGFGCWLDASVEGGASAFPSEDATVGAGQSSAAFFVGSLTAGEDSPKVNGACASGQAQGKGEWSAYVVITPTGDLAAPPGDLADRHLVKLRVGDNGVVQVDDPNGQVGGDLSVRLECSATGQPPSPRCPGSGWWGGWRLRVGPGDPQRPGDPVAQAPPVVTGQRLTAKLPDCATHPDLPDCYRPPTGPVVDDPARPVYRFDVEGAQWKGVGVPGQVTARIPAMTAQGTVDGQNWQDLGRLMPATAPKLSSDGGTVTLGPASFFWQDDPGHQPLTAVRVVSGGLVSNSVQLAGLAEPPVNGGSGAVPLQGIEVAPLGGAKQTAPRANGVDQAPLTVELIPTNSSGGFIPADDERFGLVYYRQLPSGCGAPCPGGSLVTGLYPPDQYSDYLAAGPWRGAYPHDGTGRARSGRVRGRPGGRRGGRGRGLGGAPAVTNYLMTTSGAPQTVVGVLNDTGKVGGYSGHQIQVDAVDVNTSPLRASGGTAVGGVGLVGCGSPATPCPLAGPTAGTPVLYQAGGTAAGPVTGLEFNAFPGSQQPAVPAVTGVGSLPLQVGTGQVHRLGIAPLTVTPSQATLDNNTAFWSTDVVDTPLVSSGDLVIASAEVGPPGVGRGR